MPFWRRRQNPQPIDEQEAYRRSYGPPEEIKRVQLPPRRPRDEQVLETGEKMRRAFLDRLEQREDKEEPPK